MAQTKKDIQPATTAEHVERLLTKAGSDKPLTRDELKELRALYANAELSYGNLSDNVLQHSIDTLKSNTLTREAIRAELKQLGERLGYEGASMLERMLIDQVRLCYFRLCIAEWRQSERANMTDLTLSQGLYDQRVLSMVQARYLRAIETLAKVRRLKLPALQVNMAAAGAQQLNVTQ